MSIALLFNFFTISAQSVTDTANYPYWIEMMQDENANFFETQKAFNMYWENREVTKGSGWKPFKRWENNMRTRVDENGKRPNPSAIYEAHEKLKAQPSRKSNSGNWNSLGPISLPAPYEPTPSGLGRLNAIAFHPTNQNKLYVGAPAGGLWITDDNGENWITTTDRLATLGISAIIVNYANPNIVYIGTGDRDADDAPGLGVFKSFDGGYTWQQKNSGMGNTTVNRMLIHPDYPDILFAATTNGIYKSIDAGESWILKTGGNINSMEFKPFNSDVLFAISSSILVKSENGGETWDRHSGDLKSWSRAIVKTTPANSDYVYILATNSRSFKALYKSTDSGKTFSIESTTPNIMSSKADGSGNDGQAWYDLDLAVDPINPEIIYSAGVNIFKSKDGGKTWKINAHWYGDKGAPTVHADHHVLEFNPLNNKLYSGNDGGIYLTDNGGSTWENISSGIAISQIYKIGQSQTKRDLILSGYQDNGTTLYDNGSFTTVNGGDGFECIIDPTDETHKYASIYYGQVSYSNGGYFYKITGGISENKQGAWSSPYVLNENDPKIMYLGLINVWRTNNCRTTYASWTKITSSIANSSAKVVVIENSPANPDVLYIARDDNKAFVTTNVNASTPLWTQLTQLPNSEVTAFEAHPTDQNVVFATVANKNVYRSENMGNTWVKITGNLPSVSMNTIAYDKNSNEGLYLGTDLGIFYKDATMKEWIYFNDGLPATSAVREIEIFYDEANQDNNVLRAATYGRGLWESDLFTEKVVNDYDARIIEILEPKGEFYATDIIEPEFKFKNIGTKTLDSIAIEYHIDNLPADTTFWKGSISSLETANFTFPNFVLNPGNHSYSVRIISANDVVISSGAKSHFTINKSNNIEFNLVTDLKASETSWKLETIDGSVIYSSPTYADGNVYQILENYNLKTGCYRFVIKDIDGLNGGNYQVNNTTVGFEIKSGGNFTIADTVAFCVDTFATVRFLAKITKQKVNTPIVFKNYTKDYNYSYKWFFGEGANPATSLDLTPPEVSYANEGYKTIVLEVSHGDNTVSKIANDYIIIYNEPRIISQPIASKTICQSDLLTVGINAEGIELEYLWYHNGTALNNQTDSILRFESSNPINSGTYYCEVSNKYYSINSSKFILTVTAAPELELIKADDDICKGSSTTITATGTGDLVWSNGLGTTSKVDVSPTTTTTYYATLTNNGCSNIKEATIVICELPTISVQPQDKLACENKSLSLVLEASGNALTYLWKIDGNDLFEASNILFIDSAKNKHAGAITCVVSNSCGETTSNAATVEFSKLPKSKFSYTTNGSKVSFVDESENTTSHLWDFGDGNESTNANADNIYTSGKHFVVKSSINDCGVDTTGATIIIYSGIDNLLETEIFNIYPNPSFEQLFIDFSSDEFFGKITVEVMNIEGKKISTKVIMKNDFNINIPYNVSGLSIGIYQLNIIMNDRVINRKVMIR